MLLLMLKFDKVMDHFDFLVSNGVRDQSDIGEQTTRFLRKFHPVGVRGYAGLLVPEAWLCACLNAQLSGG
ncbi:hypothetical protein BN2476_560133 [Paraburkholderia piptadeniae]|uniref:Uncharacterized protein n=1 Tax=Paraburkholderia piptadeniae TaxID=1701573 RepID=A0A1N7SJ80_9BURK|nr:hypothetical protein BN2476_560133 [Paraburkholderia piptadeniae]